MLGQVRSVYVRFVKLFHVRPGYVMLDQVSSS